MGNYKDLNDYELIYMVQEDDENARNLLFEKYKPIVLSLAAKYAKQGKKVGYEIDDLVQEGYIGIDNAIKYYHHDRNTMFYTYVLLSIKSKMLNCLRIANNQKNRLLNCSISLDQPLCYDQETVIMDVIEDEKALLPSVEVEKRELAMQLKKYLYFLPFKESLVFELKLNGFRHKQIANLLDFSPAYVAKLWIQIKEKIVSL